MSRRDDAGDESLIKVVLLQGGRVMLVFIAALGVIHGGVILRKNKGQLYEDIRKCVLEREEKKSAPKS